MEGIRTAVKTLPFAIGEIVPFTVLLSTLMFPLERLIFELNLVPSIWTLFVAALNSLTEYPAPAIVVITILLILCPKYMFTGSV